MLKQSLNPFKLIPSIQLRFNKFQHGFKGVANGFDIALQQNRMDVEANVEGVCSGLKAFSFPWFNSHTESRLQVTKCLPQHLLLANCKLRNKQYG